MMKSLGSVPAILSSSGVGQGVLFRFGFSESLSSGIRV